MSFLHLGNIKNRKVLNLPTTLHQGKLPFIPKKCLIPSQSIYGTIHFEYGEQGESLNEIFVITTAEQCQTTPYREKSLAN